MTTPAADDHHYPAALYELLHRGTPGDLSFYRRACEGADRVLELGCGYGRVLAALAATPVRQLVGLDRDPELLARARERLPARVRLVEGDMRDFELEARPFDRIVVPHSGLYCVGGDERRACLTACARHLAPGGRLVFDAWTADRFHDETDPAELRDERLDPVVSVEHEGVRYDVFERSLWQPEAQRIEVAYEYIPRGGGEAHLGRLVHHYLLQSQVAPLLAEAGLRLVSLASDWRDRPADPDSEFWVAVAEHART